MLRSLTLLGEGKSLEDTFALIAEVNHSGTHRVPIRTPLPEDDARALNDILAWYDTARDRQAKINLLVESFLIRWLADATGHTWSEVVQDLAKYINTAMPPDSRAK